MSTAVVGVTVCSAWGCREPAEVRPIGRGGRWWEPIANPAPFCPACMAKQQAPKR